MADEPSRKRCFIAVPVDAAVTGQLSELQQQLRQDGGLGGRPVPTDNFHLTLVFLGALDEQQRADVTRLLERMIPDAEATRQPFTRVHPFPGPGSRLVAVEGSPAPPLLALHRSLLAGLDELGLAPPDADRPFRPHISLLRLGRPVRELPWSAVDIQLPAREVVFYESVPEGRGVVYHRLAGFALSGPAE